MSIERLHGLSAFVRSVEAGSFTGAAKLLGTTPSAVSKSVARLETHLGVKLVHRSTRAFVLTDEGRGYHARVASLVRGLEEASEVFATRAAAVGKLRISMPDYLGRTLLQPITSDFIPQHPELALDISISDQHVDVIREGFDLALRTGVVKGDLYAKALAELPLVLVASPAYLARWGEPQTVAELHRHRHVRYKLNGQAIPAVFADGAALDLEGSFDTDSGEAMRIAAVNGVGVAQLLKTAVQGDIDAGRLRVVLPNVPLRAVPFSIVHGFGRRLPVRARVFVDFIVAELGRFSR